MALLTKAFTLLTLALCILQAVGQTIVLDQSLVAAATAVSHTWTTLVHEFATEQTQSEPASDPTATGSLQITVSDDGTINIDIPLNMRNDIGEILESVPDLTNRTILVQEVMEKNNNDVQKKGIGIVDIGLEFAGLVAILLAKPLSKTVPVHLSFPPGSAMNQVGAAAKANPKPSVAIIQENPQDAGSVVTVPLVDEPSATGSSVPCPTGPIRCNDEECLGDSEFCQAVGQAFPSSQPYPANRPISLNSLDAHADLMQRGNTVARIPQYF